MQVIVFVLHALSFYVFSLYEFSVVMIKILILEFVVIAILISGKKLISFFKSSQI